MKKLLTMTAVAVMASSAAYAATNQNEHYGADMYTQNDQIEALFDKLDLNNDGEVTINEYDAMISMISTDDRIAFQEMDLDSSKVVTREEASEYAVGSRTAMTERRTYTTTTRTTYVDDVDLERTNSRNAEVPKYRVEVDSDHNHKHKMDKHSRMDKEYDRYSYRTNN